VTESETLGEVTVGYPEGWSALQDASGVIVLGNVDLEALNNTNLPDDAIFLQVYVLGLNLLPDVESGADAQTVLEGIVTAQGDEADVNTIEGEERRTVARVDRSNEESDGLIYLATLGDDLFTMVVAVAQPGQAAGYEEAIINIMDVIGVEIDAAISDESLAQYDGLETGASEEGFPQLGNPDAPVQVVEISSFDCPACAFFHSEIFPVLIDDIAAGNVLFTYVPIFGTGGIPSGEAAARASLCALEQGNFWPYHSGLFEWQEFGNLAYVNARLLAGADQLGLDTESFETCLSAEATDTVLESAFDTATNTEFFQGTPTVLVNGVAVPNSGEALRAAVADALGESE